VTDHGIGIAAGEQQAIFEKFYRVDPHLTETPGGTGLGLYICRELAERMHGKIAVESEPGRGSTFALELPRASTE
jgi:two-component system sensor histidine kinase SenX3